MTSVTQPHDNVTITLTLAEWTQVINLVAEGSYRLVAPLIQKIGGQVQAQQVSSVVGANGPDNATTDSTV